MTRSVKTSNKRDKLFPEAEISYSLQQGEPPISLYKKLIQEARETLNDRFRNQENVEGLVKDYSWFIDKLLTHIWSSYPWHHSTEIALVAVGGYGRGELHPYSDIDIQILLQNEQDTQKYAQDITNFLTFLWDINLEVGQSVRSISTNISEATADITIFTALLEARTLFGNPLLLEQVMTRLNQRHAWAHKKFFSAKRNEQQERHNKHEDVDYSLEPNIKVSPGGLRDIQTIAWIARHYFGTGDFDALVRRGFLQKDEYQELLRGRNFLWKVRYGLHMLNKRREDRLLFDNQHKLAELFGYINDSKSLAIEKLMKKYYQSVQSLHLLNDVLLQLFDEEILGTEVADRIKPINKRFQLRNNYIEACHSRVFAETPMALIEIFMLMAQDPEIQGVRAATIRLIRNNLVLINGAYRKDVRNTSLFMELLRSPALMVGRLRKMKLYGVLSAYLPEFGRIIGQMQHDLFHIYTVDDHTLQVMENMRRLFRPDVAPNFPVASEIIKHLPKVELLYIAGLYHDIAKGRGGDHSKLGKTDAEKFCRRHGLGSWDTRLVSWLVENHLLMSGIAQREDIDDPEVIKDFAGKIGDQTRLDYLYVLTVADINGTNPSLWNAWRASLLRKLYMLSKRALSQGIDRFPDREQRIKDTQKEALELLKDSHHERKTIQQLWRPVESDYFLRESPELVAWTTKHLLEYSSREGPAVLIRNAGENRSEVATEIIIKAKSSPYLFANMTNAFERLNLNIHNAQMYRANSEDTLLIFMVLEADGLPLQLTSVKLDSLQKQLENYACAETALPPTPQVPVTRKQRYFSRNTKTELTNNDEQAYTVLEVLCSDRPGLLATLARVFIDMDITLHNAKITTLGENVEDVFFISTADNQHIREPALASALQQRIRQEIDAMISQ
jgi:[protein-PII] uridylyltransferase